MVVIKIPRVGTYIPTLGIIATTIGFGYYPVVSYQKNV